MSKERPERGFWERNAHRLEKLNYGIGGIAILGAFVVRPEIASPLIIFGAFQIAQGAIWGWIKNRSAKKQNTAPA